jgi:hypothetical protein
MDSGGVLGRWGELSIEHRRWIVYNALLGTAVVNFVVNGAIAWLSIRGQHQVPLWALPLIDKPSVAIDTVGTFFFLPLTTCVICTTAIWQQLKAGRLPRLVAQNEVASVLDRLPASRLRRGLVLAALSLAALAPASMMLLTLLDSNGMSPGQFVLYKALLGAALGAVFTPVIAACAMAGPSGVSASS